MIYTTSDWKRMEHMDPDKPVWGFMFEPSQTKSAEFGDKIQQTIGSL